MGHQEIANTTKESDGLLVLLIKLSFISLTPFVIPKINSVVKGNEAHIEILDNWFKNANPKWEVKWMIANAAKNKDGVIEQWLTTGNEYTDVENGNEIFEYNVHDILFENGKIKRINVYKRAKAQEEADFSY